MDFSGKHVVVTGGTGALGTAVVGALLEAGARCHVPCRSAEEAEKFPHRQNDGVRLYPGIELTDEVSVENSDDASDEVS